MGKEDIMRKISMILVCLGLCLGLFGCSNDSGKDTSKKTEEKEFITEDQLDSLYSNPDKFKGKYVTLTGQVFGSPESEDDTTVFQMMGDPEEYEKNTVIHCKKSLTKDLKSDSYVVVTGLIKGTFEGTNAFGESITAPQIEAEKIEISSYIDVVSPTLKSVEVNDVRTSNGVTVTLQKVEFSPIETRVYISVDNQSANEYSFYSYSTKAVQNNKQFEYESNYYADYPELNSDILPGVKTEGILVYNGLEQADFQLICKGQSNDYSLDGDTFTFDITVN